MNAEGRHCRATDSKKPSQIDSKMPNELMNHYIDIINRFVEKNRPVSLFLESPQ